MILSSVRPVTTGFVVCLLIKLYPRPHIRSPVAFNGRNDFEVKSTEGLVKLITRPTLQGVGTAII